MLPVDLRLDRTNQKHESRDGLKQTQNIFVQVVGLNYQQVHIASKGRPTHPRARTLLIAQFRKRSLTAAAASARCRRLTTVLSEEAVPEAICNAVTAGEETVMRGAISDNGEVRTQPCLLQHTGRVSAH